MGAVIRDNRTVYPISNIEYSHIQNVSDLFQECISIKRANCPDWTDESASDFGIQILWILSVLNKWVVDNLEVVKNDCYIGTTQRRDAMRRLCEIFDYPLSENSASSVKIKFTLTSGYPQFTITKGTRVSTKSVEGSSAIIFEVSADTLVTTGQSSIEVDCVQGETVTDEIIGSSDGTINQVFALLSSPVVWESEDVEVYNGSAWESYTRKKNLVNSTATDKHYTIGINDAGRYVIKFGDGTYGAIPVRGEENIRVSYRKGGGADGNVAAGTITEMITKLSYVNSVTNDSAATGGSDAETLAHARRFAPASLRTLDRIVTSEDIENLANAYVSAQYGGIAKAKAVSVSGSNSIRVMIVPYGGGYPSNALKSALETYLNARRMLCFYITAIDPIYKVVNITADVYTKSNYSTLEVANAVKIALLQELKANYQNPDGVYPHEFGASVRLSDLYAAIDNTKGVDYCSITVPSSDIIVSENEIADIGTISLTMHGVSDTVPYFFLEGE